MRLPVTAGLLVGCGTCPPLSEVPIRGGTPQQTFWLLEELENLENQLTMEACIPAFKVRDLSGRFHRGSYNTLTHQVRLHAYSRYQERLVTTLRHEVCHAVDLQNRIVTDHRELFVSPQGTRRQDRELFAIQCALGVPGTRPLTRSGACPGEPNLDGLLWIREHVYGIDNHTAARFEPIGSSTFEDLESRPRLSISQGEANTLVVNDFRAEAEDDATFTLDAWTGYIVADFLVREPTTSFTDGERLPYEWHTFHHSDGFEFDNGATLVVAPLHGLEDYIWRMVYVAPDGTAHSVDGPCMENTTTFWFNNEPWSAQLTADGTLTWGRWVLTP